MPETTNHVADADLLKCLQCAICTGSCPAARVIEGYNPRETILRYLMYGEEDEVLASELIWCCTTCHTCEERCPHGISVSELLLEAMNRAAARGHLPEAIRQTITSIAQTGRALAATPRTEKLRTELGLGPLPECNTASVQALMQACGVDKMMDIKE